MKHLFKLAFLAATLIVFTTNVWSQDNTTTTQTTETTSVQDTPVVTIKPSQDTENTKTDTATKTETKTDEPTTSTPTTQTTKSTTTVKTTTTAPKTSTTSSPKPVKQTKKTYTKKTTPTPTPPPSQPEPTPVAPVKPVKSTYSINGRNNIGIEAFGYFEINSEYESLYVNFPASNINTAGFGFSTFFEHGFSDKFSGEISLGYNRLTYANKFRTQIKENYFVGDLNGHYYFLDDTKFHPYAIGGLGLYASSRALAPTLNLGVGSYYELNKEFALKAELLYKTAIIFNRGELRFGIAYNF